MPPRLLPSSHIRQRTLPLIQRRLFHPNRTIQEYDILLLKQSSPRAAKWRFSPVLRADPAVARPIRLPFGSYLQHNDLIGRKLLDVVKDTSGKEVTLYEGSLGSHVQAMDKCATPIYPRDAQTIVNMMDLHFDPSEESPEPFEIFEAGTGAGSLTIHIARALHAANPALSPELREALPKSGMQYRKALVETPSDSTEATEERPEGEGGNISHITFHNEDITSMAKDYVSKRKAILHTLDHKLAHTQAAHALIRKFRRGLYLPHIDFHTGSISSYLSPRLASRSGKPFLSRAILDLPAPEKEALHLIPCLHPNATLIIFSPSISQIGDFLKWSTTTNQDLKLDRVAELETSSSAVFGVAENEGGRSWRVSTVVPKVYRGDKMGREFKSGEGEDGGEESKDVVQVMRPKVGERVVGGGFVAVLRKMNVGWKVQPEVEPEVGDVEEGGVVGEEVEVPVEKQTETVVNEEVEAVETEESDAVEEKTTHEVDIAKEKDAVSEEK